MAENLTKGRIKVIIFYINTDVRITFMTLKSEKYIAVIDTETNFDDEVISIGIVVADSISYIPEDKLYLIITPACNKPAMFGDVLEHSRAYVDAVLTRKKALERIDDFLQHYGINALFAYNANFDKSHLPELKYYWYDIMRLAAYRQYNCKIPANRECCKTGRMKCGYSAENIYRMLSGDRRYAEVHNALTDAEDELEIMKLMGHRIETYDIANI